MKTTKNINIKNYFLINNTVFLGNIRGGCLPFTLLSSMNFSNGATSGGNATSGTITTADFADNLENATFSDEVQEEANSYFQQIYSPAGQMHVNEFILKLKQFRDSSREREKVK